MENNSFDPSSSLAMPHRNFNENNFQRVGSLQRNNRFESELRRRPRVTRKIDMSPILKPTGSARIDYMF